MRERTLEITCLLCPLACKARVSTRDGEVVEIQNIECERGKGYVSREVRDPVRDFFTTVRVRGAKIPVLPVRATGPVPKGKLMECLSELAKVEVEAPVRLGDIVVKNILGLGVDIVATRNLDRAV
ncbi:MAG: DUF1667 domain-containing protein [Candidatus Hadarchaeales archaeon]